MLKTVVEHTFLPKMFYFSVDYSLKKHTWQKDTFLNIFYYGLRGFLHSKLLPGKSIRQCKKNERDQRILTAKLKFLLNIH